MIKHFKKDVVFKNGPVSVTAPMDFKYSFDAIKATETLLDLPSFRINYFVDGALRPMYLWNNAYATRRAIKPVIIKEVMTEILQDSVVCVDPLYDFLTLYFGENRVLFRDYYVGPDRKQISFNQITMDDPLPQLQQSLDNGVTISLWEAPVAWVGPTDFDIKFKARTTEYVGVITHPDYETRDFLTSDLITTVQNGLKMMLSGYDANLV